jgi:hypothetical protein
MVTPEKSAPKPSFSTVSASFYLSSPICTTEGRIPASGSAELIYVCTAFATYDAGQRFAAAPNRANH